MSLLLLFGGTPTVNTGGNICWSTATVGATDWTISDYDFLNTYAEWASYTYTQIEAQSLTYQAMAGDRFSIVSTPTTTWVVSTLPSENCPI